MYDERAFYPLSKDIKNNVYKSIASGTLSALYQENLKNKDRRMVGRKKTVSGILYFALPQKKRKTVLRIFLIYSSRRMAEETGKTVW